MDDLLAQTIQITGSDGAALEAYQAGPLDEQRRGGVVFIHHLPGYDRESREVARRFAAMGYDCIGPNLYSREGAGVDADDAAAAVRARGGLSDDDVVADVAVAVAHLRGLPTSNGRVGVMGFCSGGRQSVLVACRIDVDAVVDCWGGAVITPPPAQSGLKMTSLVPLLPELRAPMLGLFGNDDKFPTPADVDTLEQILTDNGKTLEFHRYDGASHSFMTPDRPSYRPEQAVNAWERITDFFGRYLATPEGA